MAFSFNQIKWKYILCSHVFIVYSSWLKFTSQGFYVKLYCLLLQNNAPEEVEEVKTKEVGTPAVLVTDNGFRNKVAH